jgi:ABC-type amino acid transport substrate-binding protein
MPAEAYQLQDAVNHALADLRREGFFERMNTRWFVEAPPQSDKMTR